MLSSLTLLNLILLTAFTTSCTIETNSSRGSSGTPSPDETVPGQATVTSVSIANHLLTVQGSHLDTVTQISIEGVSHTFQISSQSESEIQAYVSSALKLVAQKSYNLVLSSASAQTIAPITLTLDTLGASEGQVLKFNSAAQAWEPGYLNGLHFIGSWDPITNDNPSIVSGGYGTGGTPQEGDYYIVSASTTTASIDSQTDWAIGDWLIYGSDGKWHKLTGESGVKSFKGRTGIVTPQTGDYNISQLGDIDTTGVATNSILKWNGAKWVIGIDNTTGTNGAITGDSVTLNDGGLTSSVTSTDLEADGNLVLRSNADGSSSGDVVFQTGSSSSPVEQMRLTSIGLGIGTIAPSEALDVVGNAKISGTLTVSGSSITSTKISNWNTAFSERAQWDGESTGLNASTARTSLGLGTAAMMNAGATSDTVAYGDHTHTDYLLKSGGAMTGNISLNGNYLSGDGGNEGIYIDASGNIGVGTSTPKVALDVSGGIRPGNYTTASRPTCGSSILGTFIFDTTENRPYVCTSGGVWKPLDSDYDKDGITDAIDSDDNDNSDSTALSSDVLNGKTFYSGGQARTGSMTNHGVPTYTASTSNQNITPGYYSGGTITGDNDLIAGNIKAGVTIFGVTGTYFGLDQLCGLDAGTWNETQNICYFSGTTCPSGWTDAAYKSYQSVTCNPQGTWCGSQWPYCTSCTTAAISYTNAQTPTCTYCDHLMGSGSCNRLCSGQQSAVGCSK